LVRWNELFPHLVGGTLFNLIDDNFFDWWEWHIPTIEDYPYVGIDLDLDMSACPDTMLGDIVNLYILFYLI
jgi:hypothetical protein